MYNKCVLKDALKEKKMKKLLTVLLAMLMVLTLAGCSKEEGTDTDTDVEPVEPVTAKNTYADFVAAEVDTELELIMSVQAHESWWDGKCTIYGQDDDGGYLVYEAACDEATAESLVEGTLIKVTGYKAEWSGELELADATIEVLEDAGKVYDFEDLTSLIGNNDELANHMNEKASFKNLTVVNYTYNWDGSGTRDNSDVYLNVTDENGTEIVFVVRRYLTTPDSEIFQAVEALQAGDVVDLDTYLYWYEGPQARIFGVNKH